MKMVKLLLRGQFPTEDLLYFFLAKEFVRRTGFGSAAGLLADRQMLGVFAELASEARPQNNVRVEEVDDDDSDDSENSEDERQAAELVGKLERLEQLGFIKMVKKEDGEKK
jgi:hypothetical protein